MKSCAHKRMWVSQREPQYTSQHWSMKVHIYTSQESRHKWHVLRHHMHRWQHTSARTAHMWEWLYFEFTILPSHTHTIYDSSKSHYTWQFKHFEDSNISYIVRVSKYVKVSKEDFTEIIKWKLDKKTKM